MKIVMRDWLYVIAFVVLVVIFFWWGGALIAPPPPYEGHVLPISDGIVAIVYGTLPPLDASVTIGSSECLDSVLKSAYPEYTPTTDVVYVIVHDGGVRGVIPYRVDKSILQRILQKTEDGYLYYRPEKDAFDYLPIDRARQLTEVLYSCIHKYTHEGGYDKAEYNNENEINLQSE